MSQIENGNSAVPEANGSLYEKHKKIYVRAASGLFNNWRWGMVFLTQALFYGLCWVDWNGRQAVLFHLVERKFYIFGMVFWPQDVFYLALLLIISAYALFLFTAVAGRLFCGYACPQTVYTELFLWIEAKVEGDRPARMKLDKGPLDGRKLRLKTTKHALWLILSLWTGFTLVGYFTPVKELVASIPSFGFGPWEIFWILFYAGFTYMQAGFLREQVCKYMCPYARFQGVMFDPDTLIITYDPERGEPRGARKKGIDPRSEGKGDCVDCGICVQVCPTGIDIRNGLQYECIGCSACIDACDEVMDKMSYPRGLIRYSTENALAKHYTPKEMVAHVMRPRVLLYSAILGMIILATAWGLGTRIPLKVDVIRDRATLAREADDGRIENIYTLRIMNTEEAPRRYALSVSGLPGAEIIGERIVEVPAATTESVLVSVRVPPESGTKGANHIFFEIQAQNHDKVRVSEKASFMLP
ncbi:MULTISPECIES: cytochrome c oxidase accessory protein CcoG [Azospira]|jgi:cytochrome c oxidase accessory protein FixG|uniref:Cytochrome c oxidase accessory protein FixG n=2 Tax=Azospira oryzae TaxID=146939 RepID=G8QPV9_AZOOP|nr:MULTISPECIES: cytochrome c oxidase accessory protein CcoG [Azospira]AEV26018.1 cytochrome c oxidase accessory protein FixG [Azospira oryzae PS]MDK9690505.1 cytochrome c oxidase accessory protein CcoG [Azospira sp.]RZT75717.1 cytochrome c oxidase accessory protein FixG [Azospira oryzae]BBN90256.1 ferredoxin [Azospira sp. I09]